MIAINQLKVTYGDHVALNIKEPIRLAKGERLGIIGSNGAGKTTMLNALLGLAPSQGSFQIGIPRDQIAVHLQSNKYADTMPVKRIIETVINDKISKNTRVQELIRFFEFDENLKKPFSKLSGGQQQRLTLILVLYQNSPLVFFDEVTSGLDFETRQRLIDWLIEWYEKEETTLCIISHYYEELENLVNKILLLEAGEVIDFDEKDRLFAKYCGKTVIVLSNTPTNQRAVTDFQQLASPDHLIALSCPDIETENRIVASLAEQNIDYKRSSNDIEIMSFNAKAVWAGRREVQHA